MTDWVNVPPDISKYKGFIYRIDNRITGEFYIGRKVFWSKRTKPPLKGRQNKRHSVVESNWEKYWGSSPKLTGDILRMGKDKFTRTMICFCKNNWELKYWEGHYQYHFGVLLKKSSYNEQIRLRSYKPKDL